MSFSGKTSNLPVPQRSSKSEHDHRFRDLKADTESTIPELERSITASSGFSSGTTSTRPTRRNKEGEKRISDRVRALQEKLGSTNSERIALGHVMSGRLSLPLLLSSKYFKGFIYVIILAQSLTMGYAAESEEQFGSMWENVENGFTFFYFLEMCIKIYAFKRAYFRSHFNKMDFFLVWFAIVDCWIITPLGFSSSMLTMLRTLRLFRLARLVKESNHLWCVMVGILNAFKSMFWLGALLSLILYITGILCVIGIGKVGKDLYPGHEEEVESWAVIEEFNPHQYFGTLGRAVFSLFSIAILAEWPAIGWPVLMAQPGMMFLFLIFICLMTFGIMNAFIGIIVEATLASIHEMNQLHEDEQLQQKLETLQMIQRRVFKLDTDNDGALSFDEVAAGLDQLHDDLDLPDHFGAQRVIDLLDLDGNGEISCDTFEKVFADIIDPKPFHKFCMIIAGLHGVKRDVRNLHNDVVDRVLANTEKLKMVEAKSTNPTGTSSLAASSSEVGDSLVPTIKAMDERLRLLETKNTNSGTSLNGAVSTTSTSELQPQKVLVNGEDKNASDIRSEWAGNEIDKAIDNEPQSPAMKQLQARLAEKDARLAEKDAVIRDILAHLKNRLAEKDATISEMQTRINTLQKQDASSPHSNSARSIHSPRSNSAKSIHNSTASNSPGLHLNGSLNGPMSTWTASDARHELATRTMPCPVNETPPRAPGAILSNHLQVI